MKIVLIVALTLLPWHWHRHHAPKPVLDIPPHLYRCSPNMNYFELTDCAKRLNRVT